MTAHTDHPLRHFDRTCPGCVAEEEAREGRSARMDRAIYHRLLTDLCSLILGSSVPIGPMRSRKDYPPELAKAIAFLHDIRERQSASPTFTPPEAACSSDAKRYQWLRENGDAAVYVLRSWKQGDSCPPIKLAQGAELDTIIDEHLSGKRSLPQQSALKPKATIFNTPSPNVESPDAAQGAVQIKEKSGAPQA